MYMARKVDVELSNAWVALKAIKPKGASLDTNAAPAPTESTASAKLASGAEEATTAKPEALVPWAESTAWSRL
jgi:hypothetical protein